MKILSNPYSAENNKTIFEGIVLLTIVLVTLQLLLSLEGINVTFGYFVLPIIYTMLKYDRTQVSILNKIIPHFTITLLLISFAFSEFKTFYEVLNLVFLGGYITAIYRNINSPLAKELDFKAFNFIGVYSFYIVTGSVVCLFYFIMDIVGNRYAMKSEFIFGGLDFFAIFFSVVTLSISRNSNIRLERVKEAVVKEHIEVNQPTIASIESHSIIKYFEASESYLETNFSLDQLAKELNLSKQQVSELINQDMNSSFYQLVAMYRIKHAKTLIGENKNLTIEAIVDECGFSSKSTFNKYFKYFVGQTPSVYRDAIA